MLSAPTATPAPTPNLPTRTNNPGDLKDPSTGAFRSFSDPSAGIAALKQDLYGKITGNTRTGLNGNSTLMDFARVWSPTSDNQRPGLMTSEQYAQNLAKQLGVAPTTPIGSLASRLDDFAKAIAHNEGFAGGTAYADTLPSQQTQMSSSDFAAKIKAKYPAYASMPNDQLVQKIVAKYPQYRNVIQAQQPVAQPTAQPSALAPSAQTDSPLMAGAKTAANLPGSLFNFAKSVVTTPIKGLMDLPKIPGALAGLVKDTGGVLPAYAAYAKELPGAAYRTLVPEAAQGLIQAAGAFARHPVASLNGGANPELDQGLQRAQTAVTNDPVGQVAPLVLAAKGGAGALDRINAERGAANFPETGINVMPQASRTLDSAISGAASPITRPAAALADALGSRSPLPATPADIAGKIVQGDTRGAQTAAKILPGIDTSGVKTYADLSKALDSNVKQNLAKVDDLYKAQGGTQTRLADLGKTVTSEVGGKVGTAKVNYVADALDQLKELYDKTKQPADAARIDALKAHAEETGLTPHDINLIAREYGTEFGSKAFSKRTGDPLTSVNAQAYENTRSGLKDTARSFLPDNASRALDKQISDTLDVKKMVDTMKEKVNALGQRVQSRNILQKAGRALGIAIDTATGGFLKSLFQKVFMESNVGLKQMNSLDIQSQLKKNLAKLEKLSGASDAALVSEIVKLVKSGAAQLNNSPTTLPKVLNGAAFSSTPANLNRSSANGI